MKQNSGHGLTLQRLQKQRRMANIRA